MRTENLAVIGLRKAMLCGTVLVLLGGAACFNSMPSKGPGDAGAGGTAGSVSHGSGGNGSGGTKNDASTLDLPMDIHGSDPMACKMDAECSTGHCVDGLCCDTSCDGQCESCKEAGSLGTCKAIKGKPVGPRDACGGTGTCAGQCDGTDGKTCTFPDSATVCTGATCVSGNVTTASLCNGVGSCSTSVSGTCPNNQCATGGGARCESSCTASSCGAGSYCDTTGVCLAGQPNGGSCSSGATCASGYCVDGVCCDGKCDGQCESCKEASALGKCTPVKGAPLATRTACGGTGTCKGQCDGVNRMACAFPDGSVICAAATCTNGKATTASVCNGSGACTMATTSPCTNNMCATDGSGKCAGGCTATSCTAGTYCDSTGTCAKTLDSGASCSTGTQCTSGNCVDGVCCDAKCDGQCQSCKESGSVGTCKTVKGDPISPRAACGGTGKCKAQCDGTSATACTYPGSSTECTAAKCSAGKVTTASVCNSSGSCTTSGTNACESNLCGADGITCAGSCTATSCAAGSYCGTGGACAPTIADGKVCSGDSQCTHGHCVDGVCCATACGACHSCTTGLCNMVPAATACSGGVCNSTGTCTACTQGASCTTGIGECQTGSIDCSTGAPVCKASNKNSGTQCGNGPTCSAAMQYPHQVCNSSGQCTTPTGLHCDSGQCNASSTACLDCVQSTAPSSVSISGSLPICAPGTPKPTSVTLTVLGGTLGTGASWVWYSNSAHTVAVDRGKTSITVSPPSDTTYYVRAEGSCNTTADKSAMVTVRPAPTFKTQPKDFLVECDRTATVPFTVVPTYAIASIQWYASYDGTEANKMTLVDGNRYWTGGTTQTLNFVPQSTFTVWCTIIDACGVPATSDKAVMDVPARDDNGNCIPR